MLRNVYLISIVTPEILIIMVNGMYHLNEKQLAQFKLLLNSKIIKVRQKINTIFLESSHSSQQLAAKNLVRLSADELIEFTSKVENASLARNVERLKKLDASLIGIEQDMYGLCADCESELTAEQLSEDPTMQRCTVCETKYQKQRTKYRL